MNEKQIEEKILKKWEKATLSNNFLFYRVMHQNPNLCKELLEILLSIKIDRIKIQQENSILLNKDSKGIRLDLYLESSNEVFDIEMQTLNTKELPERARFYQSVMDVDNLKPTQHYKELKSGYVIFICLEDIFKENLPVYTFENRCQEKLSLKLNDRTKKIFFNSKECAKMLAGKQKAFFEFLIKNIPTDNFTEKLSESLIYEKQSMLAKRLYMEYERQITYWKDEGMEKGFAKGERIGLKKGILQGEKSGITKGILQTAKNMLSKNIPLDLIQSCTGLSIQEIQKL